MFLHAESIPGQIKLQCDGSLDSYVDRIVAFLRIGTDYKDNFYQIEVPLKPSEYQDNTSNRLSAEEVWIPDQNSIEVSLDLLAKLKAKSLQNKNTTSSKSAIQESKIANNASGRESSTRFSSNSCTGVS